MKRGSTNYYYHYDGLGSVSDITNTNHTVVERYSYDVYGQPLIKNQSGQTIPSSAISNRYMFTGREYDVETGLYHYRARAYSLTMGRFLQRDPLDYYDSMNLYEYCWNNPVNWIDPSGEIALESLFGLGIVIVGGFLAYEAGQAVIKSMQSGKCFKGALKDAQEQIIVSSMAMQYAWRTALGYAWEQLTTTALVRSGPQHPPGQDPKNKKDWRYVGEIIGLVLRLIYSIQQYTGIGK